MKNSDNINWSLECEKKLTPQCIWIMNALWDNHKRHTFWLSTTTGKLPSSGNTADSHFALLDKHEKQFQRPQ